MGLYRSVCRESRLYRPDMEDARNLNMRFPLLFLNISNTIELRKIRSCCFGFGKVREEPSRMKGKLMKFIDQPRECAIMELKVTNMDDLIWFHKAFSFSKSKLEQLRAEVPPRDAPVDKAGWMMFHLSSSMLNLPRFFDPLKGSGWKGTLHFKTDEGGEYTLRISEGMAEAAEGLSGSPTCEISASAWAILSLLQGLRTGDMAENNGELSDDELESVAGGKGGHSRKHTVSVTPSAGPAVEVLSVCGAHQSQESCSFLVCSAAFCSEHHGLCASNVTSGGSGIDITPVGQPIGAFGPLVGVNLGPCGLQLG